MSLPEPGPHMQAVLEALRTRTGQPIGYRVKPALSAANSRYAIVYGIGETRTGSPGRPYDDATYTLQLTCVAWDGIGVDVMQAEVQDALLGAPVTVDGRAVSIAFLDGGVDGKEQDTAGKTLFYATPRYRLKSLSSNT